MINKIIIFFLLLVSPAYATTYYCGSGQAQTTIAQVNALDLVAGDIVLFNRGETWSGLLSCKDGVTYSNYGSGALPKINGTADNSHIITILDADDVIIDGLAVGDGGNTHHDMSGIAITGSHNVIVRNCNLNLGNNYLGIDAYSYNAARYTHDILIENNIIANAYEIGIQNNSDQTNDHLYNITIRVNKVSGTTGNGINIGWHSKDTIVEGNYVTTSTGCGICFDSGIVNGHVRNNICYNNVKNIGTEGDSSHGDALGVYIDNNTCIYGATTQWSGFRLSLGGKPSTIRIRNNIVVGKSDTYYFIDDIRNNMKDYFSDYNYFYNETGNPPKFNLAGTVYNNLTSFQTTGNDTHSITDDPLLTVDYHLQSTSPCIGNGTNLGITEDYWGNPRPRPAKFPSLLPDIGASEYIAPTDSWMHFSN